jgi:hypothetical protein
MTPVTIDHALRHPDTFYASGPWSEAQTLHVAAAYSNPKRWSTRRRTFNDFRRHMAGAANVQLHVGELAYGDRPFEVTDADHPLDHQWRTSQELWHKENILNLVISRFPADWQYGAYLDGDFCMTRPDWALETIHLLQHFDFVQLFSTYQDLGPNNEPLGVRPGFAYNFARTGVAPRSYRAGAPGGGWAFRRIAFNAVGGLLDVCILGSGDSWMAYGLSGQPNNHPETHDPGEGYADAILRWQQRAAVIRKNFSYLNNHAIHYWHGSKARRGYSTRWQILRQFKFDPRTDLFRDWQGIYQLTPDKPGLRDAIRQYFASRNEDDSSLGGGERPTV